MCHFTDQEIRQRHLQRISVNYSYVCINCSIAIYIVTNWQLLHTYISTEPSVVAISGKLLNFPLIWNVIVIM